MRLGEKIYILRRETDFPIDESWLANDGLVNVVSAKYPFGSEYTDFDERHIRSAEVTHNFYIELTEMINSLPAHGRK